MYREDFKRYLEDLAAKKPAPGGGSASALVSSLGIALLEMVCNFTLGKEKYKEVEGEIKKILAKLTDLRDRLEGLIDEDVYSYRKLREALKLPKDAPQEKVREERIQSALKKALDVPLKICEYSLEALRLTRVIVSKANPNLITDTGAGVFFLEAGFNSAVLNVKINLKSLKDNNLSGRIKEKIEKECQELSQIKEEVLKRVYLKL